MYNLQLLLHNPHHRCAGKNSYSTNHYASKPYRTVIVLRGTTYWIWIHMPDTLFLCVHCTFTSISLSMSLRHITTHYTSLHFLHLHFDLVETARLCCKNLRHSWVHSSRTGNLCDSTSYEHVMENVVTAFCYLLHL